MSALMVLWSLGSAAMASPDCVALDRSPKPLVGTPGERKIAYIVGIGDYEAKPGGQSIDLVGPPNDARRIRDMLIERYGFPVDNICTLLDNEATRAAYIDGWRKHVGRASQGDTVVYYFAGHGSQTTDFDGPQDEPDGMDETILLHDSRATVPDFLDDEFNALLAEAYQRTTNITVLVDACNSGTTTRSVASAGFAERRVEPTKRSRPIQNRIVSANGDYRPERFPELVTITAAQDGTSALERGGQGVFTNALLRSLDARGEGSWSQIMPIVPRWIAAQRSFQVATFEGQLDREIFGQAVVDHSLSWQVHRVSGDRVKFRGPAMPGWTEGAIVEVFADKATKRRGRVRLEKAGQFQAEGVTIGKVRGISPGDYAILETPGRDTAAIRVRITDGVAFASALRKAIRSDDVISKTVLLTDGPADFVVRQGSASTVEIVGSEGTIRNRNPMRNAREALDVAKNLGLHARQASLLALSAEPNEVYPHDMLDLRITQDPFTTSNCARTPYRPPTVPVPYVQVPMCTPVQLEVSLRRNPEKDLYIGILYLANDGSIAAWPEAGVSITLKRKDEKHIETLGTVTPPLDAPDRILVFGSHEPVRWSTLQARSIALERSSGKNKLQSFVLGHISGTRGIDDEPPETEGDPAWTSGFLQLQVVGDPTQWSSPERNAATTCERLRQSGCQ